MRYEPLDIVAFGSHLLETQDLDPIYVGLWKCINEYGWEAGQVDQWLVAYWCTYHAGLSCWFSELETPVDFWYWLEVAARNTEESPMGGRWPRAKERRYWRGEKCVESARMLAKRYECPSRMVGYLSGAHTVRDVISRVKEHYLFGDWIGFKVADMLERCLGVSVSFDQGAVFMFKDPREAAKLWWRQRCNLHPEHEICEPTAVSEALAYLDNFLGGRKSPPSMDRFVDVQEFETILCKWKSHVRGHYPLFNDIDEIHHGLEPWLEVSEAAAAFKAALPRRPE